MELKWIKLCVNIFDDEKIALIESMPDADSIIVIWFKILCLAGKQNNCGVLMLSDRIPYTEEMLATIFRRPISTVRLALTTFESFGMIAIVNGTITIPNWEKHQSVDAVERYKDQTRERVANYRQRQKAIAAENSSLTQCNVTRNVTRNVTCNADVTPCNAIEEDIDKDIEEDIKEIDKEKPTRHKYGEYQNVLLSDEDFEKLKKEFFDWSDRIERLSAYMASTGKSYKNHLATIRNWARRDSKTPTADVKPTGRASYDLTEFERAAAQKPIVYKRKNND